MSQLASTTVRYYQPWVKETAAKYHLSEDHLQSLVGGFLDGVPFDALVKKLGIDRDTVMAIYRLSWMRAVIALPEQKN